MDTSVSNEAKNLLESQRWLQFLDSTARALEINLVFQVAGTAAHISVCDNCPVCHRQLPPADAYEPNSNMCRDEPQDQLNGEEIDREIFELSNNYRVIARRFLCRGNTGDLSFHDKVRSAKELLGSFLVILTDQWNGGQIATELAALHHINQTILSMFRSEHQALDTVLDLILSAAVILLDASGSWLEYTVDGNNYTVTKGQCQTASDGRVQKTDHTVCVLIDNIALRGTLGIVEPLNTGRMNEFLGYLVQECSIAFEIDSLLKLMESKSSLILGSIDDLILLVDRRRNICYANKAASVMLGKSFQDLLGRSISEIEAPWHTCIQRESDKIYKGCKDTLAAAENKMIDWDIYPLEGGPELPGWLILARDRTDFYRLQELGDRIERLVNISDTMNVMAHEIRNPLATFKGILQIIDLKVSTPDIRKYVDIGVKEIRRLSLLLDDFMQLGKSVVSNMEKTDLKDFIRELTPLLGMEFNDAHLTIDTFVNEPPSVQMDKRQITQVLINLVKNAYEAMNGRGTVKITVQQHDDWAELSVSDSGPGIPGHLFDKLFKPYYSTKPEGTGLGLTVSQAVVQNHGGDISAKNNPDKGACFTIRLPAFKEVVSSDRLDVLLITEDDMIRLPAERIFNIQGINTKSISRHSDIFQTVERNKPAALFIDGSLFDPEILNQLLKNVSAQFTNLKILMASTDHELKKLENIHQISQPVNYYKLVQSIKYLLSQ